MANYVIHEETLQDIADIIRKKDGTQAGIDPATYAERINLMGMLEEKTVSGAIVTFADGADTVPLKKCEITLPASLDGYSEVDVIHTGKNLWEFGDQTVDTVAYIMLYFTKPIPAGTYTISCELISTTTTCSFRFRKEDGSYLVQTAFTANSGRVSQTLTLPEPAYRVYIYSSTQAGGEVTTWKNVQIEVGSIMTDFTPYTAPTTHTADLGRTIYGGQADIVNGTGKAWGRIDLGSLTWTKVTSGQAPYFASSALNPSYRYVNNNPNALVEGYTQASIGGSGTANGFFITDGSSVRIRDDNYTSGTANEFKEAISGKYIAYELATPTDFTFDKVPIDSKLGNNTIWSEQGDTEVTYRGQGTAYIYPEGEGVSF